MVHCAVLSHTYDPQCVQQNVFRECIRQQEIQYSASCFEACCRISFCLGADAAGCTTLAEWKQQGRRNCLQCVAKQIEKKSFKGPEGSILYLE